MKSTLLSLLLAATLSAETPPDVSSLDAIVKSVYDVISGPAGQKRDWDRMRSLFHPGARLIPTRPTDAGGAQAFVLSLDEYIQRSQTALEKGFFESEIHRETQTFGNIAQVFSTYESRHAPAEKPFARGINSFQLLKDGKRWWVITIFWDSERPTNPLP
ncbi:MAG: nuclear transport factor 2 family protein [Acidobacteriota bacterium]|nr:nuclear transport factor 2 family protein [Acidobacteriota bacterium]